MANECDRLARTHIQGNSLQGRTALLVFKNDVVKLNITLDRRHRLCPRLISDARLLVDKFEDPFRRGHRHKQLVVHHSETVNRFPEVADIVAERDEQTDCQFSRLNQIYTKHKQNKGAHSAGDFDDRPEHLVHGRRFIP
ncbi:hypothetical protein D3C77_330460 [compost metagenome]